MINLNVNDFVNTLKEIDDKIVRKEKIQEHIQKLRQDVHFGTKMDLPDDKMVALYRPLVNHLIEENKLLLEIHNLTMFEDIQQLLELNQSYIRKTKEQFDEIEALRTKLVKQQQDVKSNTNVSATNAELQETKQKLQQRDKRVKELNEKVDWLQAKRKDSRELSKKEQKLLKLYNTPKQYFLESKKWYVKPLGIFFRT